MKENKTKEIVYHSYLLKHIVGLFILPIMIIGITVLLIIMICNGVDDIKAYIFMSIALIIAILSFVFSLYVVKKNKR